MSYYIKIKIYVPVNDVEIIYYIKKKNYITTNRYFIFKMYININKIICIMQICNLIYIKGNILIYNFIITYILVCNMRNYVRVYTTI